ncbi:MAG: hypothetical protein CVU64_16615 [Deltaproteobacteria bacterium HGW-Deltaproteobacteria-21]|nr:MAG: hypothetical protein CVU64_16615 [Deltaproteobacteria bacterium HGW-Deltaproteobacteria-21]
MKKEWYQWRYEFMRRNPEYRAAYKEALQLREQCEEAYEEEHDTEPEETPTVDYRPGKGRKIAKGWIDYPYFHTSWGKQEEAICEKVGHYAVCMTNPGKSYEQVMKTKGMERTGFLPSWKWFFAKWEIDGSNLTLRFDLSKINSYAGLPKEAKDFVEFILNGPLRSKRIRNRFLPGGRGLRVKDYDFFLDNGEQIEHMRLRKLTYDQCTKRLMPGKYKHNQESTIQTIKACHKEYIRLTKKGGYREITFP